MPLYDRSGILRVKAASISNLPAEVRRLTLGGWLISEDETHTKVGA
jgi:hypothetical protein